MIRAMRFQLACLAFVCAALLQVGHRYKTDCPKNSNFAIEAVKPELQIAVDEKLELLYAVFALAEYPLLSKQSSSYKTAVYHQFQPYKEHQAVILAKKLMYRGFNFDYAVNWLYQHDELPELRKSSQVAFDFSQRPMNEDSLVMLRHALSDFHQTSGFGQFYQQQKPFFDEMISLAKQNMERDDLIPLIQGFFGVQEQGTYRVILSPLLHSGGFAINRPQAKEMFALVGPNGNKDSIPTFDQVFLEQDLVIHEFSHNYANPVVGEFMEELSKYRTILYEPFKEKVKEEGYASWEAYMYELMVRATTARIVADSYGYEEAKVLLDYEASVGFDKAIWLFMVLEEYTQNRHEYPQFADYMPALLKRLASKKAQLSE